jgi:membrane protease YdiL (CAAX protease family)
VRRALGLADSPIGRGLPRRTAIAMCIVALCIVARDLLRFDRFEYWDSVVRVAPAALAACVFVYLARDRLEAVGIRGRPLPSWRYWRYVTLALALIFALLIAGTVVVFLAIDKPLVVMLPDASWVWSATVDAPLVEETIYRWVFVTGLVAVAPRWLAVVASGALFAYLHFLYGNAGPDNFVGGYFFAWMYLKSGSIVVPIVFHAAGNGALIVLHVAAYYLM